MEKKEKNRPTDKRFSSNDGKKRRPFPQKEAKGEEKAPVDRRDDKGNKKGKKKEIPVRAALEKSIKKSRPKTEKKPKV